MKHNLLYMGWAGIILGYILLITIFVWLVYPYKTVVFNKTPQILNSPIKTGGELQILNDYCKYTDEIPMITRHFIDGIAYDVPAAPAVKKVLGCGVQTVFVEVPLHLPPGKYMIQTDYTYHPNPLRTIVVTTISEKFVIN